MIPDSQGYAGCGSQTSQTTGCEAGRNGSENDDWRLLGLFYETWHHGPPTTADDNQLDGM